MTEQEFIDELGKLGVNVDDSKELIEIYYISKKADSDITLKKWFDCAVIAHEKIKNNPEGFISLD